MKILLACALCMVLSACGALERARPELETTKEMEANAMELGNFSVSLTVKDLAASRAFYEKLGFAVIGGAQEHNYLILRNGAAKIGLFEGMFERNMLTFNPGWDAEGSTVEGFTDVRELQRRLRDQGIAFTVEAEEESRGPASFMIVDPDGNPILVDQHTDAPGE